MGVRRRCVIHTPLLSAGLDENDGITFAPTLDLPKEAVVSSVGAGDAFIAGFLAGLLVLLLVLNTVFSPKRWYPEGYIQDRNARTAMLSCEEPETIDIINVGDSESGMDFNPMTIWENNVRPFS